MKSSSSILNSPRRVVFAGGDSISYVYAADGTKLRSTATIGGATAQTDYCGNVIYENGFRKYLLVDGGYVTLSDGKYHYYLRDHQGNNRVVAGADGTVEEVNHYYPSGGVFAWSGNAQPYESQRQGAGVVFTLVWLPGHVGMMRCWGGSLL